MAGSWNGNQHTGDSSAEIVTVSAADELIWTFPGYDVIRANGGNDTVDSGMESAKVFGGAGNDLLYDLSLFHGSFTGLVGKETLFGGALGDILDGVGGNDNLSGLGDDDLIDIGTGNFTASGGAGFDALIIDLSPDSAAQKLHIACNFHFSTPAATGSARGFEVFSRPHRRCQ